jgi:parallel beta-helix repeat protein
LTLGEIAFSEAATIVGLGTGLVVIDANNASRVFNMSSAPNNSTFDISSLAVKGGSATTGGGILAGFNNLNLANCVIIGNKATQLGAGVDIVGKLTATNCLFTLNSGGASAIRINGTGILTQCTISGNTAFDGAGLSIYGFLTVDSCTISNNTATGSTGGGGVEQTSLLGSVFRNSTISGNTAASGMGGGVLFTHTGAFPDFQNCTITDNSAATGGGIASMLGSGIIDLISSIVSGNSASVAADLYTPGTVNAQVSLMGSSAGVITFTADTFTSTNLGKAPLLGPLANNGGPTETHALLPGSPAINNGSNPAGLVNDQRGLGFARSVGQTDIGAFESQIVPAKVTNVQVNDGSAQRSRVTSLTITFDQPPSLPTIVADGFDLRRQSDNSKVLLDAVPNGNTVVLSFTGGTPFESGSLADGRYTLTALASKIPNLDGNGDSTPGDDFVLIGDPAIAPRLFRLLGDADGSGTINSSDFAVFRTFFGVGASMFDYDNDGQTNSNDFAEFRKRFGLSI